MRNLPAAAGYYTPKELSTIKQRAAATQLPLAHFGQWKLARRGPFLGTTRVKGG
jgi:hypothetical protein